MNDRRKSCTVSAALCENEIARFEAIAKEFGVSRNVLMRRLVQYFLGGKISWTNLFQQTGEFCGKTSGFAGKKHIRVPLEPEVYASFARSAGDWGSTASVVLRRLILLYLAGSIKRGDIW